MRQRPDNVHPTEKFGVAIIGIIFIANAIRPEAETAEKIEQIRSVTAGLTVSDPGAGR